MKYLFTTLLLVVFTLSISAQQKPLDAVEVIHGDQFVLMDREAANAELRRITATRSDPQGHLPGLIRALGVPTWCSTLEHREIVNTTCRPDLPIFWPNR